MQDDSLSVELLVYQHVQVVLRLLHVDWNVNALPSDRDWDRVAVILVFEKECEFVIDISKFVRNESEGNFKLGVTFDLGCSLELDLCQELFEVDFIRGHLTNLHELVVHNFLFWFFLSWIFFVAIRLFFSGSWLIFGRVGLTLSDHTFSLFGGPGHLFGGNRHQAHLLLLSGLGSKELFVFTLLLLAMPKVIHTEEWHGPALVRLDIDLSGQSSGVLNIETDRFLLSENHIVKVDFGLFDADKGLLTGANQSDIDGASFTQDREARVDVLVQLRSEGDRDVCREAR